jgi:hypothetical protein
MASKKIALPPLDAAVPALHVLLGSEAREVIAAGLATGGLRFRKSEISQVRYVPGRSVTAQYRVESITEHGKPVTSTFVALSGIRVPDGVPVLGADGVEIAFWQFPNDPFLPGLAAASDAVSVSRLLDSLGAETQDYTLRTRAYRAGRRAVVEANGPSQRMFLKVVRPSRTRAIQEAHVALAAHVPVPHSFGWSENQGIVALQSMPGRTLRAALRARSSRLPEPRSLVELLDRFPAPSEDTPVVTGPHESAAGHVRLLSAVAPELAERFEAAAAAVGEARPEPTTATHGDFHASQILIEGSTVVGLVDVDTAGKGERANDFAALLGQLSTLAVNSPARSDFERYGAALIDEFDRHVDPVGLRLRTAGFILGLATGPFRVQGGRWRYETEQRLGLAERWIGSANKIAGDL